MASQSMPQALPLMRDIVLRILLEDDVGSAEMLTTAPGGALTVAPGPFIERNQLSRRKLTRVAVPALAVLAAALLVVPAVAQNKPAKATQTAVGGVKFVPNRLIGDTMRFKTDSISIRKGGTLTLVDKTKAPHTLSLVKKSQVPRKAAAVDACFERGPCGKLAVDHGAINPDTGEEQDPTTPLVNAGKAGFNQPGDSVIMPPNGRVKVKVTSAGPLYYICAIHPWMLGAINGKAPR
jgi:plastocyanin